MGWTGIRDAHSDLDGRGTMTAFFPRFTSRRLTALMTPQSGEINPAAAVIVLCLVIFYAVLSTAAMTCFPLLEGTSEHHQHSHSGVSHASHCVWGCSFTSSPSLPALMSTDGMWLVLAGLSITRLCIPRRFCPSSSARGRSPPANPCVLTI